MIEESQTLDLEHIELVWVIRAGGVGLGWLDAGGQDGPLELQYSVTHVHLAQVPKVMCTLIPA